MRGSGWRRRSPSRFFLPESERHAGRCKLSSRVIPAGVRPVGAAYAFAGQPTTASYTPSSLYTYAPGSVDANRDRTLHHHVYGAELSGGRLRARFGLRYDQQQPQLLPRDVLGRQRRRLRGAGVLFRRNHRGSNRLPIRNPGHSFSAEPDMHHRPPGDQYSFFGYLYRNRRGVALRPIFNEDTPGWSEPELNHYDRDDQRHAATKRSRQLFLRNLCDGCPAGNFREPLSGHAFDFNQRRGALTLTCSPTSGPVTVGVAYSSTCPASGGVPPYSFKVSGAKVPGVSEQNTSTTTTISGTPTTAGAYSYTVIVSVNATPVNSASVSFTGTIAPGSSPSGAPQILTDGIVSSASFAPARAPGGAIPQGSIFSIFGNNLGPPATAQQPSLPLTNTLAAVSITVTAGSTTLNAIPVYVSPTLINAVMPSNAPLGKVIVQVTFAGVAGNSAAVTVVANQPMVYTATGAGVGPAILQNYVPGPNLPINAASRTVMPGQIAFLYLTGLGAISGADNQPPPNGNLPYQVEVWIGGVPVTNFLYAGRSPCCSGLDEIIVTVSANAPRAVLCRSSCASAARRSATRRPSRSTRTETPL
jgi:uncharacterized protein (TIGR03437 family)